MSFTTIDLVKGHLQLESDELDAQLATLITWVDSQITSYVQRSLSAQSAVTEYFSGNGQPYIELREAPIRSITGLWVDQDGYFGQGPSSPFASADELTEGTDFVLVRDDPLDSTRSASGLVKRLVYDGWERGDGNIKVTYAGGFATLPKDVEAAATLQVASYAKRVENKGAEGPVQSERLGDYAVTYALSMPAAAALVRPLLPEVAAILQPYRHIQVA